MPFLVWALDGAGPIPITSSGNRYVLVGVDLLSSLVVLKCISAMNTENTIKFFWENIIAYYGLPEAVLTDHGSNFDNIEIKKMFSEINCKKIYSSPYNPQCNGASENKVKILKKILSHSCGKLTQVDWDEKILRIMLSMNSSLNTVRKFSSFTIVHGFSGKSLVDLQFNKLTNLNYFDGYDSYVTRLIQNICEIHQTCLNEIKIQRSKQAIQYNKDSKETLIASGDIVYCRDTTSVGRKSTNYSFRGLYVVLSEVHKNVFYLASLNTGLKVGESCYPSDGLLEFLEYKENIIEPVPDNNFHQTYGIEGPIVPGQWNSIFVYTDIVQRSRIENTSAPTLRILPRKTTNEEVISYSFQPLIYLDISRQNIEIVHFSFRTEKNNIIPINRGLISLTVEFREDE
ncbi:hypothetical protein QYM36_014141 [Artemia franciscana]|uniref:Integrase catalytic domain-containing protein n=1 Tax=Artemia franciscana TaxID=6661 RepID=A0AA88HDN5_ARTSF|nr:hypothetical protein QYM36_014141 [Artemia franciscana]